MNTLKSLAALALAASLATTGCATRGATTKCGEGLSDCNTAASATVTQTGEQISHACKGMATCKGHKHKKHVSKKKHKHVETKKAKDAQVATSSSASVEETKL